jgi:hypothetical protein
MLSYVRRHWLNHKESPSTGSVVVYHGPGRWEDVDTFIEIADCHSKVQLHLTKLDTTKDFILKLRLLAKTANDFADWLEKEVI